jgi:hypothetical protein
MEGALYMLCSVLDIEIRALDSVASHSPGGASSCRHVLGHTCLRCNVRYECDTVRLVERFARFLGHHIACSVIRVADSIKVRPRMSTGWWIVLVTLRIVRDTLPIARHGTGTTSQPPRGLLNHEVHA